MKNGKKLLNGQKAGRKYKKNINKGRKKKNRN